MKKVYAINGSPRRNKNTAQMLDKALEGVDTNLLSLKTLAMSLFIVTFFFNKSSLSSNNIALFRHIF